MLTASLLAESLQLTLVAGGAVAALAWFLLLAPDARHRALRPLPCPPSTLPVLGNTLDLMHLQLPRLHDWILEQCLLHGGKTWRLQALGAPPLVVVSSVACFEDVLKTQFEVFDKGERMNTILRDIMGDGIFAVDGDKWRQQRKALVHLFTMRQFRDTICGTIETHLLQLGKILRDVAVVGKAPSGELFPLGDAFQRFAFDTFTEIAFGFDEQSLARVRDADNANASEDARATDAFFQAINDVITLTELRFHQPDWLWQLKRALNVGAERKLHNAVKAIDHKVYAVIQRTLHDHHEENAQKPKGTPAKQDVVGLIMEHFDDFKHAAEDADDQLRLSKFLRDVGLAMLAAGKDTTGTTLQWCLVMFGRTPRVIDEIRKELRAELPRLFTDDAFVPPMEAVEPHLVYLEACIRETLRLCPPGPLNAKEANRDTTLCDGTFLKRGTRIYIPSYALARMPAVWGDDAAQFKPERWIDPDTGKLHSVSSFQFVSFHAGPRICVGMRFALVQLKTTLAYLLSKFDFALEKDPHAYTYQMAITFALQDPLRARVVQYPPAGGA